MTELLSTGILKDDRTNQYLGKNDKGKFKYNKNEYGSDKAFIIDLQDENDDKEEYLDDKYPQTKELYKLMKNMTSENIING